MMEINGKRLDDVYIYTFTEMKRWTAEQKEKKLK